MLRNFLFIILITSIFSCSTTRKPIDYKSYTISKDELNAISSKIIFTSKLDKDDDPTDNLTEFSIVNETNSIAYISWFDLIPGKNYFVKIKWFGPDNEQFEQRQSIINPKDGIWYSWFHLKLIENVTPKGKFKVQVFLNNELAKESFFFTK